MTAQTSDYAIVMERLENLERQNRRMKQAGAAVLILAAAVVLMGHAPATRTVEANEFIVKDSAGRKRMELTTLQGGPVLLVFNEQGEAESMLGTHGLSLFEPGVAVNRVALAERGLFYTTSLAPMRLTWSTGFAER